MDKDKKYIIECTREQLMLIARCVEDCHRFASGQTELENTTPLLDNHRKVQEQLRALSPMVSGLRHPGASYGWNGGDCPNDHQRRFIAQTYPIYREIYHFDSVERGLGDVYSSMTLTCEEGGEPIKIRAKEDKCLIDYVNEFADDVCDLHDWHNEEERAVAIIAIDAPNDEELIRCYGNTMVTELGIYSLLKEPCMREARVRLTKVLSALLEKETELAKQASETQIPN